MAICPCSSRFGYCLVSCDSQPQQHTAPESLQAAASAASFQATVGQPYYYSSSCSCFCSCTYTTFFYPLMNGMLGMHEPMDSDMNDMLSEQSINHDTKHHGRRRMRRYWIFKCGCLSPHHPELCLYDRERHIVYAIVADFMEQYDFADYVASCYQEEHQQQHMSFPASIPRKHTSTIETWIRDADIQSMRPIFKLAYASYNEIGPSLGAIVLRDAFARWYAERKKEKMEGKKESRKNFRRRVNCCIII